MPADPGWTPHPPAAAAKRELRARARALRAAWATRADGARARDQAAIAQHLFASSLWRAARTVLCYLPFGDEIHPLPLRLSADGAGFIERAGGGGPPTPAPRLVAPRIDPSGELHLHALSGPLRRHRFGPLEPLPEAPRVDPTEVDLALVPGLAFSPTGGRLGYGGGYYDRLLPQLPGGAPRIGVTLEALLLEELPSEAHDARVTFLLSEAGLRPVGP